ncbi:UNVERIFIED_CONTAM: hypothetical protein FKN15_021678 [Acipenser sinensis]
MIIRTLPVCDYQDSYCFSHQCGCGDVVILPPLQRIRLPKRLQQQYPSYGLYLYGEGIYAEENKKLKLTGIPVLFLPGNAGSYKQARSLGSVALRKAENMDSRFHLNVFTVDFNEELVALYGGSLQRQTKFIHECIRAILKLYKPVLCRWLLAVCNPLVLRVVCWQDQAAPPSSVAVVGHSMGGIVARALFTLPKFNHRLISLIITQATPHQGPVLPLDSDLLDFYTTVNQHWSERAQELRNVTVLSVGGGFRDYQVRSGLTALPCPSDDPNKLSLVILSRMGQKPGNKTIHTFTSQRYRAVRDRNLVIKPSIPSHHKDIELYGTETCLQAVDLSWETELLPAFKVLTLKLDDYPSFSHIVVSASNTNAKQMYQAFTIRIESHCQTPQVHCIPHCNLRVLPCLQCFAFRTVTCVFCPVSSGSSVTQISARLHSCRPDNTSTASLQLHTSPSCRYTGFHPATGSFGSSVAATVMQSWDIKTELKKNKQKI